MSPGLRLVLPFLLAAALTASAGPDDLFDAGAPGAFQPGQKETLLSLENGRYTIEGRRVLDSRTPLTNAKVAALLAGPALRAAPSDGSPGAEPNAAADAAYQRAMSRVPKGPAADLNFDGKSARSGGVRGPPGGAAGAPGKGAASDPGVLQAQFVSRLQFQGNKDERAAMSEAVGLILKTKTGRDLAARFVKDGATAVVKVEAMDNAGETDTEKSPPVVGLSRAYMKKDDPTHSRVLMAGTLAHELFGHAYETQRARKAGFPQLGLYHYRGDEIGSRLIDWLVQTELAGKVADENPEDYLRGPEKYHRRLQTADPYYITTMSRAEMKDPVTALRRRRERLADETAKTDEDIKGMKGWLPIIAHFVGALHKVAKARFAPAQKELDEYFEWAEPYRLKLVRSKEALEGKIALWSSRAGADERKTLRAAADSAYMKDLEAAVAARARELRKLRAEVAAGSRKPASEGVIEMPPLVIGGKAPDGPPIDLEEVGRMRDADVKKNPGHLK